MLRFIIQRSIYDIYSQAAETIFETIDIAVPDLEFALLSVGHGPAGHDVRKLIGVEVLPATPQTDPQSTQEQKHG